MTDQIDISIVVPLYNEEAVFAQLTQRLSAVIDTASFKCEVILVNDGSSDNTAALIEGICTKDTRFYGSLIIQKPRTSTGSKCWSGACKRKKKGL